MKRESICTTKKMGCKQLMVWLLELEPWEQVLWDLEDLELELVWLLLLALEELELEYHWPLWVANMLPRKSMLPYLHGM